MAKILNGKIKVLVVDNDKDMSWLIARILKEEGFKVDITHSVESALEKIAKHPYHLIVLDYKLSGKSGLFVLDKTHQISPSTVTIMISAFGNAAVKEKAKEFGAYAFLDKPFNIDRLKKMVKKALTEQKRRCADVTNWQKLHSHSTPGGHLSSSGFCSTGADSGSPKDRHPVHIGAG
jgi:DNA-binding NtrC family response regulator